MNAISRNLQVFGKAVFWSAIILLGLFVGLLVLVAMIQTGVGHLLIHALFGFVFFLLENIPRTAVNAATWVPGVAAFVLGLLVLHLFLKPWAGKRGRHWTLGSSIALASWVPVLFVISFLVPGVFLHLKGLFAEPQWLRSNRDSPYLSARLATQKLGGMLVEHATISGGESMNFPATLADLEKDPANRGEWSGLRPVKQAGLPAEMPIYLGNGFSLESDPELPLLISVPFTRGGDAMRFVFTIGSGMELIPSAEAEEWIGRSLAARRASAEK